MARLSDVIEQFIKDLLNEKEEELQIQRNELADYFNCAPSQINYVLTTRFTYDKGYIIESKRGGGGCILIKKVSFDNKLSRLKKILEYIGSGITYHKAAALLESLYEAELITERELAIIKLTVNDRTLSSGGDRNKLRADILKSIISIILS
ncbi:MAG: CtsR family transcriptional regulator [Clostridiaceae bacterium]